jgi:hypothetical protein
MKEREDVPTAPRRGRTTVRLTVSEIWHEIVGVGEGDVTGGNAGKANQIFGGRGKGTDKSRLRGLHRNR